MCMYICIFIHINVRNKGPKTERKRKEEDMTKDGELSFLLCCMYKCVSVYIYIERDVYVYTYLRKKMEKSDIYVEANV